MSDEKEIKIENEDNKTPKLLIKRLSENAIIPKLSSVGAAGYDLSAAHEGELLSRGKVLVKTDLSIMIPKEYYGRVKLIYLIYR
jgi:dUTP pyrophosphatase